MPEGITPRKLQIRLLLLLLIAGGVVLMGHALGHIEIPAIVGVVLFVVALAISFVRGTDALYLVIFAVLFSPEIGTGMETGRQTGEGTGLVIRLEDVLLVAVGAGWILRSIYLGRRFGILRTPVNGAIGYYVAATAVSTLLGMIDGRVGMIPGFFHNLKYFEYFFLFFMLLAHVRQLTDARHMIGAMLMVFFLAMIYGYSQIALGIRVSAPFDAEPNTFGGYIVLMQCVAFGILLHAPRANIRWTMAGLLLFSLPPFLFTLSRSSYIALLGSIFVFLIVSRRRILIFCLLIAVVALVTIGWIALPQPVEERIRDTFIAGTQYHVQVAGIDLDPSASARILSYEQALRIWVKRPLFGYGVTGTHFIDGQYIRVLAETGVVGLLAFFFIFLQLLKAVWNAFRKTNDPLFKGAALGFFCGIIATMLHATAANSFIIIRIAEPFWLLAGLVLLIPYLQKHAEGDHALTAVSPTFASSPNEEDL